MRQVTPAFATACAQSRARASDRSTGFSQKIAFFAAAARWMSSACVSVDEPMTTALTTASPKTCSALPTCAPYFCASSAAAVALTSTTYLSLTPGWRTILPAWILPMRPAPKRATSVMRSPLRLDCVPRASPCGLNPGYDSTRATTQSGLRLLEHPLVHRIVLEMPFARRSRHHVEVIRIVAIGHDDRMIAARHHHDVVILDCERLVEQAIVGVHALEREALRRVDAVVIGFFQRAFDRKIVGVVLVRRVRGRMSARREYLHDQQVIRRFAFRQNVAYEARIRAGAAREPLHGGGLDKPRSPPAYARRAADAELGVGVRHH